MSRAEFEDIMLEKLNTPQLKQLHNALLMEIIGAACTSEPDTLTTNSIIPTNKRRRLHSYQGNADDADTFHSGRLKYAIVSLPRAERSELLALSSYAEHHPHHPRDSKLLLDEVRQDNGYQVGSQRRAVPNVLALCSLTRTLPSLSDLHERIKSSANENGLQLNQATTRTFTRLFNQALEEFLVKVIMTTLTTITRSDSQYESIQLPGTAPAASSFLAAKNQNEKVTMSVMSLATTFYITPSLLSFPSPAVLRVMMQDFQWSKEEEESQSKAQRFNLGAKPMADYIRLLRVSRSGGPMMLQEYGNFQ